MVSRRPLAIAVLTWTVIEVALEVLSRAGMLSTAVHWYVFYCVGSAVAACLYLAMWRLTSPAPGSRIFLWPACMQALAAVIGLAAFVIPDALGLIALPQPFGVPGLFDILGIATVSLAIVALLRTKLVPAWVALLRIGTLAAAVGQDVLLASAYPASIDQVFAYRMTVVSYAGSAISVAFWVILAMSLLRSERQPEAEVPPASDPALARAGATTAHMVAIVVVILLLLVDFPPLVLATVFVFHGFNLDLAVNIAVAGIAYGTLWAVGKSLDAKYRSVAAASVAAPDRRPSIPQGLTDAYGLMLVCLLPFLFFLFVLSLYGVELLITVALTAADAVGGIPYVVIFGLLVVAAGSVWGVALGVWRLMVAPKTRKTGVELARTENQALWATVDEVASDSGTRTVDRLWIASDASIAVWEEGGLGRVLGGRAPRCMTVGLTAVHDMSVPEFKSILRHEFAHFSNRDTAWGSFTYSMTRSLLAAWKATPGGNPLKARDLLTGIVRLNPAWWVYWLFVRLFFRSTAGFSRVREMLADWDAVSYAGGECFANGLTKVIVNARALDSWMRETNVQEGDVPSIAGRVAEKLAGMGPQELAEARESALARPSKDSGAYDTHPDPKMRLAYARRSGDEARACAEDTVKGLIDDWDSMDARASQAWLVPQPAS